MRGHPDHHDAELLLRLYDLRREEKLRQARDWFMREFRASSLEDLRSQFPLGSQGNVFFRMVVGYWEMAASIVNNGLIQEEFFFESNSEIWMVWEKIKHLAPSSRKSYANPYMWKNLETLADKYEKWMAQRAPEALSALRKLVAEASAKK